jgi:TPR repeat protein
MWYTRAAEAGDREAQFRLEVLLSIRRPVPRDA